MFDSSRQLLLHVVAPLPGSPNLGELRICAQRWRSAIGHMRILGLHGFLRVGVCALALLWPPTGFADEYRDPRRCAESPASLRSNDFARAAARNAASLVSVLAIRPRLLAPDELEFPSLFQPVAGVPLPDPLEEGALLLERSFASGFIYSADGDVLTSAHAVAAARDIWVLLADGRQLRARLRGLDRRSDVAVLRVEAGGLQPVQVAASTSLCPGDWVAALGSPFGFSQTVSAGVISAYPRWIPGFEGVPLIQSDVALNPGSSGGPLFNADGVVVGMSSMIFTDSGVYQGVSFALPIDRALRVVRQVQDHGMAWQVDIGARLQPLTTGLALAFGLARPQGALIIALQTPGPAQHAGLQTGDIIVGINGRSVADPSQAQDLVDAVDPSGWLAVEFWRDRSVQRVRLRAAIAAGAPAAAQVAPPPESRLGLELAEGRETPSRQPGALVAHSSGSALLAGIETGDRILAVNGRPVQRTEVFDEALASAGAAPVVAILLQRGTVLRYLAVQRIRQ